MKSKGKFIVIEGIDGCGKTTQINELYKWLPNSGLIKQGLKTIKTREPGGSALGEEIRNIILNNNLEQNPSPLTELLLYSADRAEHVAKVITPALQKGNWVISDRFADSTLAYQGYGRNINLEIIKTLEGIVCQGEKPDLTILLDISAEESIKRRTGQIPDRIESEGIRFLRSVSEGFKIISKSKGWETITASQKQSIITDQIKEIIIRNFGKNND